MQGPGGVANEFVQLEMGVAGKVEDSIVDEADGDLAVAGGLNDIALANRIANFDWKKYTVGPRQRARTDDRLNFADNLRGPVQPLILASRVPPAARRVAQTP